MIDAIQNTSPADLLRASGARVTAGRTRVLALLRGAPHPVSHGELESALAQDGQPGLDRVTLYRILDDFIARGLALKAADARGVFRYSAVEPAADHGSHAHFRCSECGRVFCLDVPRPTPPTLPPGFRLDRMELDIRGVCARCNAGGEGA